MIFIVSADRRPGSVRMFVGPFLDTAAAKAFLANTATLKQGSYELHEGTLALVGAVVKAASPVTDVPLLKN